jgi:hypothetical protein
MSETSIDELIKASENGDSEVMRQVGISYRDGKGTEVSLDKAIEWFRKSSDKGNGAASVQLMDVLMKRGNPEDLSEMLKIAHRFADDGNGDGMVCLGRAYRYGKGVDKDLNTATEWFRKAASAGVEWATNELFDTLWEIGTPESYGQMIEAIRPLAFNGNPGANARLGKAFHSGKGVEKNDDKAEALMHYASIRGFGQIDGELKTIANSIFEKCDKKMTDVVKVYHVGHYGFFWKYLVHYYSRPSYGKVLFLFNTTSMCDQTIDFINSLKGRISSIGYVETYREDSFFKPTEELVREESLGFFDSFFAKHGIDLSKCEIYTGFDAINTFPAYLADMKIPFTMCDPGNGDLLKNRYHLEKKPVIIPFTDYSEKKRTLNPDNPYVRDIISFSKKHYNFDKTATFFDCEQMMSFMSESQIKEIYRIFEIDKIKTYRDMNLLVCSSAWIMMRGLTYLQYIKIYADLIDYSLGDKPIKLKLHPNADFKGLWENYFDSSDIIRGYVPSQILFAFGKLKPKMIISTGSTGSDIVCPTKIDLTPSYMDSYRIINKVYFTFEILKEAGISGYTNKLFNFGFLDDFLDLVSADTDSANGVTLTLSEIADGKISEGNIAADSDVTALYPLDNNVPENLSKYSRKMLKFRINKEFETENLTGESDEIFFLYVKNDKLRKKISKAAVKKHMFHSKEWISVFSERNRNQSFRYSMSSLCAFT